MICFFYSVYCLDPPVVQHSTHNGSPESVTFPLETVLKYTCYPGYLTVGFAHAKCFLYNDTAQWFGPDITCKGIKQKIYIMIRYCFIFQCPSYIFKNILGSMIKVMK